MEQTFHKPTLQSSYVLRYHSNTFLPHQTSHNALGNLQYQEDSGTDQERRDYPRKDSFDTVDYHSRYQVPQRAKDLHYTPRGNDALLERGTDYPPPGYKHIRKASYNSLEENDYLQKDSDKVQVRNLRQFNNKRPQKSKPDDFPLLNQFPFQRKNSQNIAEPKCSNATETRQRTLKNNPR